MRTKIWISLICVLCFTGCYTRLVPTTVVTLKAGSTIDLPIRTFNITKSNDLITKYPNHFNKHVLNKFINDLEGQLIVVGLSSSEKPDIELRLVEFNLLNGEIASLKIEIYSGGNQLEIMTYRPLDIDGRISYFKRTPTILMVSEKIAKKVRCMFNLKLI